MFIFLDHLLNGALIVAAIGFIALIWDMASYMLGGHDDNR